MRNRVSRPDYFKLFGLKRQFEVDAGALKKAYLDLQRKSHPDINKNTGDLSSIINEGYQTLKSPLPRAIYLVIIN
jgi:molecular chaperone HscB